MLAVRAVFAFVFLSVAALAEAAPVLGSGGVSCVTWSADRQRNQTLSQQSQAWILGFLSGYNFYGTSNGNLTVPTDTRRLMLWVDNFCDTYPHKDIIDAAKALVDEFSLHATAK
jgi:hypothetical protein